MEVRKYKSFCPIRLPLTAYTKCFRWNWSSATITRQKKIAYPPDELDTEGENFGVEPSVGDVCLYEPWGNVCIFYEDFSYSEDLVYLGQVESGMEALAAQNGDFAARIEPDEEQE